MVQLNTLVAQLSKNTETIDSVGKDLGDLYDMVVHKRGAYDLNSRLSGNSRTDRSKIRDADIIKLVEGLPDV